MVGSVFPNRLAQVLGEIRQVHPLPAEQVVDLNESRRLLRYIQTSDDAVRTAKLGRLSEAEQRAIYGLYLLTAKPGEIRRIDELVIRYAGWTLFNYGWASFQTNFPQQSMQRSLTWLWHHLNNTSVKGMPSRPAYLDDHLAGMVSLGLPAAELLTATLALMQKVTGDSNMESSIPEFFDRHLILAEGRFAAMLLELWILDQEDSVLVRELSLLQRTWPLLPPKSLSNLLVRVQSSTKLSESERRTLLYAIEGSVSQDRREAFLDSLGKHEHDAWQAWKILDALRQQYRAYPTKQALMLRFHRHITSFTQVDSHTIAWCFPGFYVVDSLLDPEHSYVYPTELFRRSLKDGPLVNHLGLALLPYQQIRNAQDAAKRSGIFQIEFIEPGLTRATDYLRLKLGLKRSL